MPSWPEAHLSPGATVTPAVAGWRYLSFATAELDDRPLQLGDPEQEVAIVTLSGGASVLVRDGARFELPGRASVWDGLPWALYLPAGISATATAMRGGRGRGGRLRAEPWEWRAPSRSSSAPIDVRVEIRGAGNATRQINHIITPDFPADRLEVVEVYTPSGNWSSWPPHKHDTDAMPHEAILEEIYHYRFRRPEAWGVQRLYGGSVDGLWPVRDGETVIVRDGYHPFVATHGDDAYYLNALAGDVRTMACSFDPAHEAVMDAWPDMEPDPRVPLVG